MDILEKEELAYKYVGQVFDTYIIIQIKDKMYIIDQHAAHERLLYEQIKENAVELGLSYSSMIILILKEYFKKKED